MKFKVLLSIATAFVATFFIASCDSDTMEVGGGIQPDTDDILLDVDHVYITAQTVSLSDYMYVKNDRVILGELNDNTFGSLKSEFLAEFYCNDYKFILGYDGEAVIDSVQLRMGIFNRYIMGDTVAPMAVSVYELDRELKPNYFTNIKPSDYCDKNTILGQRFFSPKDLMRVDGGQFLNIDLNKEFGTNLYKVWKDENPKILSSSEELKKYTKGIYVTSDLSNKTLIEIADANATTDVLVYYTYKLKKVNEPDVDSLLSAAIRLPIAADAIKLNSLTNSPVSAIKGLAELIAAEGEAQSKTFIKSPAGAVTQIRIPLKQIKEKAKLKTKSDDFIINSAVFKLTGLTEEEDNLDIKVRPNSFLFVNKDSINNFFLDRKKPNGLTSMTMHRDTINNTYNYAINNYYPSSVNNNLASLINYYLNDDLSKDKEYLEYYVIPVTPIISQSTLQITGVENFYSPSAAILRTKKENMKMSLIFSKHNDIVVK